MVGFLFLEELEASMGMAVPYPESSSFWVSSLVKGFSHARDGFLPFTPRDYSINISPCYGISLMNRQSLVLLKVLSCLYSLDHSQVWFWVLKPCCYFLIWWWPAKLNRFNSFPSCYFIQVFSAYPIWDSDIFLWLESTVWQPVITATNIMGRLMSGL